MKRLPDWRHGGFFGFGLRLQRGLQHMHMAKIMPRAASGDLLLQPIRHSVGDTADHCAAEAVSDERHVGQVLAFYDVGDIRNKGVDR